MLRNFDMNLFLVLHTLLEERSVTRAGARLGRTQSAISNSLKRLRDIFDDPLFVRMPTGLSPTPKAIQLGQASADIIRMANDCLAPGIAFDPKNSDARFVIGAPDRLSLPVFLPFLERIRRVAPGIAIDLRTTDRTYALQLIMDQEIDIALGWFDKTPPQVNQVHVSDEQFVVLCRPDHPILEGAKDIDFATLLSYPHLVVSSGGDRRAAFDGALARRGLSRNAATSLTNFTVVPELLRRSTLIGVFTRKTADYFARNHALATRPVPSEIEPISNNLIWHRRFDADPKHLWLRKQLVAICS